MMGCDHCWRGKGVLTTRELTSRWSEVRNLPRRPPSARCVYGKREPGRWSCCAQFVEYLNTENNYYPQQVTRNGPADPGSGGRSQISDLVAVRVADHASTRFELGLLTGRSAAFLDGS